MFDKLKLKSRASDLSKASTDIAPSKKEIFRSRLNFGVNLGGCFILEKWIFHDLFPEGADCELDAVKKTIEQAGAGEAQKKFEEHWSNFMTDDDWKWLQDHKVTSVRVPIGYWEVNGGKYTKGTKFSGVASVYANAWDIFKKKFVEPAGLHNISVVVDLHGVPGGANDADHSGEHPGGQGKPEFWSNEDSQLAICDLFTFIAKDLLPAHDNIAAIQVVNESVFANDIKLQARYYSAAIALIRSEDGSIPVVISDGWWPDQWVKWVQSKQSEGANLGVVVDTHCYRCFSDDDKNKSPQQIINDLDGDLLTNLTDNGSGVDFMVGEYSCVLDGQLWDKDNANAKRDDLVVEYGKRESELIPQKAKFGSFFWTYKFQSGNGGEWDFRTMTDKGAIIPPRSLDNLPDQGKFDEKLQQNLQDHSNYWDQQNANQKYEHWRYEDGFKTAWEDSLEFAKFDGSRIGRVEFWKAARASQHISSKGSLKHVWEWYQGFDKGLQEFANN